ncbi:MAG TPA: PfkB family carbohydrate kinase [Anaerovoracaceae bacterium]|nr:PfkB family carbohydrate kinase [Anaerovoracaceae bacterium]
MVKVIGIGDNVVDKYLHLGLMFPGGNAVNVPVFMAKAGAEAAYLGHFGTDRAGVHIKSVLAQLGISLSHSLVKDGPNAYASVTVVNGERVFLHEECSATISHGISLSREDLDYISGFDVIHTSIYSDIEDQLPALRETGVPISYDFSEIECRDYFESIYPYVTYAFFSAADMSRKAIEDFIRHVSRQGPRYVMATRGAAGALLFFNGELYEQPVVETQVVDTMGAGDSFIAAFLKAVLEGKEVTEALRAGALSAAQTCTYQGTFGYGIEIG